MKKKPPALSERLVGALAAARTTRTRLYSALGHKHLDDSPHFSAELHAMHRRIDEECVALARLLWKVREHREEVARKKDAA